MFWHHNNSLMNRDGTNSALFYMGPKFRPFCVLLLDQITYSVKNNLLMYAIDYFTCRL